MEISRSKEPIRLFRSSFLEFFTHIHPATVLILWLPVASFSLIQGLARLGSAAGLLVPPLFAAGLVLWTLTEYLLHRFVFHFSAHGPRQERALFVFHGIHHAQPRTKTRLVMSPAVSIPMSLLFYLVFWALFDRLLGVPEAISPLFAGFAVGYILYDMTHYAMHYIKVPWSYFAMIRSSHMRHHGEAPDRRFGVTNLIWDRVFGTLPDGAER